MTDKELDKSIEEAKQALTPRQINFAEHYVSNGMNATQAAKSAGYSEKSSASLGSRQSKDVKVIRLVDLFILYKKNELDVSRDAMLKKLYDIIKDGSQHPITAQLKAIEMIGKMMGYNAPEQTEVKHTGEYDVITERLKNMSADEMEIELARLKSNL